jgi:hypothetical protein
MPFWIREFKNSNTGQRYCVRSEAQYLPPLRQQVADQQEDAEWLDGECPLKVEPIE